MQTKPQEEIKEPLELSLTDNLQKIKELFGNSDDIIMREIRIGKEGRIKACIIFTDGLIDSQSAQNFIMESLMIDWRTTEVESESVSRLNLLQYLKDMVLTVGDIQDINDFTNLLDSLLNGKVILLFEGYSQGFAVEMKGGKERSVEEPTTETTIRGPREGFTENIRVNTSLLRRKIRDHNLWIESRKIGKVSKTNVSIMYINGIANDKIVEEVRKRLDRIKIDSILETGYIEELIQDAKWSPFPTMYHSERPDAIAADLLEGRIAILVDGTPFVITIPVIFAQFLQSPEDYYNRADITTLLRFLRYVGFFIALLAPSFYIAITTFHQEMLPTQLLITLAAQREGVPFPAFIEALAMEVSFEILREAGLRMPKAIGQAVSIVGTLVIGSAAVEAGFVSAAMVIVVAITAISSFIVSNYELAISIRMLRFPFMAIAASFGLFGIIVGLIALILHMCSLRSFGIPYMAPFGPFIKDDQKDAIFRMPRWAMFSRPRLISQTNITREDTPAPKPDSK
ncbi:spore germination protein [Paenibacillus sp. BSR1-1]|uniref:spore germination protein n=1 Tax=Paenibacillus sp. BSR1-1 TaxID=3020845 RepID=UPI0025B0B0BE|nr:spore germination protein [Paenibacillus sp. BSR1-1]MDN3019657.1 spore germination protein [Paenibacillus sp. BSR1-1]